MAEAVLRTVGLSKRYGLATALQPLDYTLVEGEFLGVLGPNGGGKSTLLGLLAGQMHPTGGVLEVFGQAAGIGSKAQIAYMPEIDNLYPAWTAADAYRFLERYFDMDRARFTRLLGALCLDHHSRFSALSKGNRTRLRLALTLARHARLYLLDEPLSGIDPVAREEILRALLGELPQGATVVLATHQVAEAERLFDRVLVLNQGRAILDVAADDLRASSGVSVDQAMKEALLLQRAETDITGWQDRFLPEVLR